MRDAEEGRILYVPGGLALAASPRKTWVLPQGHALWMPPGTGCELDTRRAPTLRRLRVARGTAAQLPDKPFAIAVSPLLRAALLRYLILEGAAPTTAPRRRLMAVIMDEVEAAEPAPWFLPLPRERRLGKITRALIKDPSDRRGLEEFAAIAGTGPRTLARLFVAHTGLSFGAWRQRLRLLTAMTLLEAGTAVASVAHQTGFASPSAFVAAFKRSTGTSPGRYFRRG